MQTFHMRCKKLLYTLLSEAGKVSNYDALMRSFLLDFVKCEILHKTDMAIATEIAEIK